MLFNSLPFLVFLPIVVFLYWILPPRYRTLWLLGASCYFYMAFVPAYILVLAALILVDYMLAFWIARENSPERKWWYLACGIGSNLLLLFVFKYFNFASSNLGALLHFAHFPYTVGALQLLLPLGLSFHTFQSISYLIEVYRGNLPPERDLSVYALFVMFFPQLVAGPIERGAHMLPQFHQIHFFSKENLMRGLRLLAWGFFLKVAIADRAGMFVDAFYQHPSTSSGPATALALVLFAFQLYGDFAGYTFIARGSAAMMGFDLVENFHRPYFARSIAEFWQRWHISLSSWLRDYVYLPILRRHARVSMRALYTAVIFTFLASGLWHGAGWTFIGMGLFYGIAIVLGLTTKQWRDALFGAFPARLRALMQTFVTFGLVCIGWLLFRAPSLGVVGQVLGDLRFGWGEFARHLGDLAYLTSQFSYGFPIEELLITLCLIAVLIGVEWVEERKPLFLFARWWNLYSVRAFAYSFMLLALLLFGEFHQQVFIYFQF